MLGGLGGLALTASAGLGYAVGVEPHWFRITRYRVTPKSWAKGLRLRLAVLADLHTCEPFMTASDVRAIVAATNAQEPDLVALLGDYVADHRYVQAPVPLEEWARALAGLHAPLGVHAILGNHDWWDDKAVMRRRNGSPRIRLALEDVGIPVYENDARLLRKGEQAFWIAGLGDQWAFPRREQAANGKPTWTYTGVDDVPTLLSRVNDQSPVILMAHEPDAFAGMSDRVSLTLAGHMHGGQVRIAGYSPFLPSRFGDRYRYGHIVEQGRHMIVSGGLGCSFLPARFGSPPEIVLVDIGADA
jgi:uncharacterized protein